MSDEKNDYQAGNERKDEFSEMLDELNEGEKAGEQNQPDSANSFDAAGLIRKPITDDQLPLYGEKAARLAGLLDKEKAKIYKAVVIDYHPTANYRYTVGLVGSGNQQAIKVALSRLLGQYSVTAINFAPLNPMQYQTLYDAAYSERAIEQKQNDNFKARTRRTIGSNLRVEFDANLKKSIDELAGNIIDLTDVQTYEVTIEGLESGTINYRSIDARQLAVVILQDFFFSGASDVHFESSDEFGGVVRYREKGEMQVRFEHIPLDVMDSVLNTLCIFSNNSPPEMTRINVESKIRLKIMRDGEIKFITARFQSCYSKPLPSIVLRGLDNPLRDINLVGLYEDQKIPFMKACWKKAGVVVVTGATGSGKTQTLEAVMADLERDNKKKIIEVGDPCEYSAARRVQINVPRPTREKPKHLLYEECFTGIMRLDPNTVYFTEMRAANVAAVVIETAITGHSVFTSMHAADVQETFVRLLNMKIERDIIAKGILAICAQTLVSKLCMVCREVDEKTSTLAGYTVYKESGYVGGKKCRNCDNGFSGRTAVAEILVLDADVQQWINEGAKPAEVVERAVAAKKLIPLREIALRKLRDGITSESQLAHILAKRESTGEVIFESPELADDNVPVVVSENNYQEPEEVDYIDVTYEESELEAVGGGMQ